MAPINGVRAKTKRVRMKRVKGGEMQPVTVSQSARGTREEQLFSLVRTLTVRRASRPEKGPSAAVIATQVRLREERAAVKAESRACVK